jgi:Tfp pilus assembly protein PilX
MQKNFMLLIVCFLFLTAVPAHAVLINLSAKECEEAISFGRANSALIDKELDKRYSFGSTDEYAEGGTIHSKWYKLALMAGYKAQKSETITTQEQSEILSDPYLQINIMVHGQSLDFAKGYTVSLLQRGREIIPDKFHADHFMHQHHVKNQPSGFPCYRAVMRAYFKYSEIDPAGAATLKVKKNGKTAQFDIDFARFR